MCDVCVYVSVYVYRWSVYVWWSVCVCVRVLISVCVLFRV